MKESVEKLIKETQEEFFGYLSIPTVSAQNKNIPETVAYVKEMIEVRGGEVKVLDDLGGNPVVYAYFAAKEDADNKATLLFYNHYDVQPPDPLDEWETEAFTPTIHDGKLFCRGVSDNKGNLMARLVAIEHFNKTEGGLPCNVKFLIEGEEEIGSVHLEAYIKKYADLWADSDGCIWEFGGKQDDETFLVECGLKGLLYMELQSQTADIDAHSSLAAVLDNAAWRLTQALASMKSIDNEILIEGFYDEVIEPTADEKAKTLDVPVTAESFKKNFGMRRPFISDKLGIEPEIALAFTPTLTINGLLSGYTGLGAKTVLPKSAMAKLECRLVPAQTPKHIFNSIRNHLDKNGFADIELRTVNDGQKAYRSSMDDEFIKLVGETAEVVYAPASPVKVRPTNAGTGPMDIFGEYLIGLPMATSGVGYARSQAHAPNESIRLADYQQGVEHMVELIARMNELKAK
jgi:Acetylornithine deacetylase/Succinyl-diaminopimelate desuccinylase and related deacylases